MAQERTSARRKAMSQPIVTRFLARRWWSSPRQPSLADSVVFQRHAYERSLVIVRAYYAFSVLWMVQASNDWARSANLTYAHPLWPTYWWFHHFTVRGGVNIIFWAYLATSVIVALVPERRLARAAYAFAFLQYMALVDGFDKSRGDLYAWFFVSVVLILLPRGPWRARRRIAYRQFFLTVIWTAQLVLLFFYSLSGLWKIYQGLRDTGAGKTSVFNFSAFSYIVSASLLRTNATTVLGHFLSQHEMYGWVLLTGTIYLETCSVIIAFRPRLQRLWGLGLIAFHIGTQLAMGFTFTEDIVLLGLFLLCSPFVPDHVGVKDAFLDLPVIHFTARWFRYLRDRNARRPKGSQGVEPVPSPP
jgi:hypothetical protein